MPAASVEVPSPGRVKLISATIAGSPLLQFLAVLLRTGPCLYPVIITLYTRRRIAKGTASPTSTQSKGWFPKRWRDRWSLGTELSARAFPVPLASGGEHGAEGRGVGGGDHRPARGAAARHGGTADADDQGRRGAAVLRP